MVLKFIVEALNFNKKRLFKDCEEIRPKTDTRNKMK